MNRRHQEEKMAKIFYWLTLAQTVAEITIVIGFFIILFFVIKFYALI